MNEISLELPSYNAYKQFQERIERKIDELNKAIQDVEAELRQATADYQNVFSSGEDTATASATLKQLKDREAHLKHELEIVEQGFNESQLARKMHDEYRLIERTVYDRLNTIWDEAEQLKNDTRLKLEEMEQQSHQLRSDFRAISGSQLSTCIECLNMSDSLKNSLRYDLNTGSIPNNQFPKIK